MAKGSKKETVVEEVKETKKVLVEEPTQEVVVEDVKEELVEVKEEVIEEPKQEKKVEVQPEVEVSADTTPKCVKVNEEVKTNNTHNMRSRMFGYSWNGQEFD